MFRLLLPLVLVAATLSAVAADTSRSLDMPTAESAAPLDRATYDDFARTLAQRLNDGEQDAFAGLFDKQAFIGRALRGLPESRDLEAVRTSLTQQLDRVGAILLQRLNPDYEFRYLRSRQRDAHVILLYRVNLGDEGLNYLELEVAPRDGAIRIIDWYDYASAQNYSDSIRQALLTVLPLDRGLLDRLFDTNGVDEAAVSQFVELARLQRERRFDEWLAAYEKLPESIRSSRIMVVLRVANANSSGDEQAYREALDAAARYFGDDPRLALLLMDHYMYTEQWDKAHTAVDNLAAYTGGDAAIDGLRANVYLLTGNDAEALHWAERTVEGDATYEDGYWTRLEANVNLGHFEAAVNDLQILEHTFGYSFDAQALAEIEGYEAFGRSDAFRRWARKN